MIVDGIAALYLERGGSTLQTLPAADDPDVGVAAARSLRTLVLDGRVRELVIRKVDGEDVADVPVPRRCSRRGSCPATAACRFASPSAPTSG